jgi:hypothetical protein
MRYSITPILHVPNSSTARFPARPLVTEALSIKVLGIMGAYKGRVNVKHRKRRAAKVERLKTVAAKKEDTKKTA